jgi:hypothetical protein
MTYKPGRRRETPYQAHHANLGWVIVEDIAGIVASEMKINDLAEAYAALKISAYCMESETRPEQIIIGTAIYGKGWVVVPPTNIRQLKDLGLERALSPLSGKTIKTRKVSQDTGILLPKPLICVMLLLVLLFSKRVNLLIYLLGLFTAKNAVISIMRIILAI